MQEATFNQLYYANVLELAVIVDPLYLSGLLTRKVSRDRKRNDHHFINAVQIYLSIRRNNKGKESYNKNHTAWSNPILVLKNYLVVLLATECDKGRRTRVEVFLPAFQC